MRGARGGQSEAASQPSPPRGGVFSSIKSALQGWNSRGADQGDSEPGAAGEGARLSPRAPVLRLAVLLWSAALLAPLPRQAEVEPGRSTLARHLLGRVALLPAAPAHAQSTGICDRTPAVRTAILGRISGITDCRNVTSSHLSGITGKLDVSRRRLTSLQENDFDGLSNLEELDLYSNSLNSLHEDIFDGLSSLETIWLSNNSLRSLSEDIFDGLSSLDTLYLNNNSLSSLHEDIFNGLTALTELRLTSNGLSSLDEDIFNRLSNLENLNLSNNSLSNLDEDIFNGLSSLSVLSLANNSLSSLPGNIFDDLTSLGTLWLYNNSLRSLPEGLRSVTVLRLANNDLVCLPRDLAGRPSSIIIDNAVRDLPDCYGVSLSVSPTEVSEGSGGESITVTATLKDGNRVKSVATTVTISVEEDTAIEGEDFEAVSDFAITIASGSSSSSGTFTLTARKDAVADDSETVKVTGRTGLSSSSVAGTEVEETEVSIRNTPPAVELSPTSLTVTEDGSGIYTVVLDTLPSGNVTITASSGDSGAASISPATLTFSTANWNTAQTVTVTGVEDDDANNETVNISHSVSGYGSVSSASNVTVTVNDDETAGVSLSATDLTVNEGGSGTYTVVLDSQPSGSVTITPSSDDSGASSISPATLTFTTANWNTAQTVTVTGVEDDDANNETVNISHGVSGYGTVSTASNVTVTVNDDETAGVSLSATDLTVNEGGSGTYTVVLDSLPSGSVTVTASGGDSGASSISPATLTFSTSDWNTAQTVTVTGVEDDDANNETVNISHGVSGYGSVSSASNVTVTVNDDETAGVSLSATDLTVNEGGSGTYTMVLESLPGGNVTVTASSGDSGASSISPATLIFSTSNWNTAQTVTVTGVEDDDANNETVNISHGVSGYGTVSSASNVTVTVNDDETAGVSLSATDLTVNEGGSGTYTVVLDSLPSGSVTVTASGGDSGASSISPATLTFSTSNWNTAQTVTVTGVEDDDIASGDERVSISHAVGGYGDVSSADAVSVTVRDDDTAGVSISPTSLTLNEGGSDIYTVVLESEPTATVTITPSSSDGGAAMVTPSSLTFTTSDWNTAQTVTVSGVENDVDGEDQTIAVSHGISGGGYGSISVPDVTITVNDDDTAGVSISPTSLSMTEGETGTYTVVLESEPTGTVTITPSSGDGGAATVSPSNLTFSSTTWNTAQTITVTALQDDDNEDETIAVSHSVRGYGSISSGDMVTVTVRDDDEATGEAVIQAWLPRFGRSVAQQVVERVSRRLQQRPQPGLEVSVAGEQLTNRGPWEEEQGIMAKLLGFEAVSEGQLVEGTEFAFSPPQQDHEDGDGDEESNGNGEGLAFWGAGELSSFNGRQDTISLSATVTTALVAADWQSQRWQAGTALAHSWGRGSYQESSSGAEGQISSNLTGLFPYGRYALNPKLNLWGVVGHGWGRLSLLPQEGDQESSSIEMSMAAVGLDGLILDGGGSGLTIRSRADALLLGVSSEQSQQLAGVEGEVSRLRLGLEAQRPFPISQSDAVLTPSLALAIRQDSGDAETGFGLDLAASLLWSDPLKGMEVEVAGRSLLSHGDQSFQEQGLAASFSWDPNPSSPLGLSLSLSQSMGASASSGSDALLNPTSWPEMEASTSAAEVQQFGARMGYGLLAYRDALLITPELGVDLSSDATITTLGFSLAPYSQQGYSYPWQLSLERQQHSSVNSDNPTTSHSLQLRFSLLL